METAQFLNPFTQDDIGPAARHVGGNGHCAALSRIGDNLRFRLVVFGVEDAVLDPFFLELAA